MCPWISRETSEAGSEGTGERDGHEVKELGGRSWQIGPCRPCEDVSRPVRLKERGNPRIVLSRVVT